MTLFLHSVKRGHIAKELWKHGEDIGDHVIWFDLISPTEREERAVEDYLRIDVPTRDEMRQIEVSNRLYTEHSHVFMTATLVAKFDTEEPENQAVTFIVSQKHLVTIRYSDPLPFKVFTSRIERLDGPAMGVEFFMALFEAIINRAADILEKLGQDIDIITKQIFPGREEGKEPEKIDPGLALERIGQSGDIISKARESLSTLLRLASFASMQTCLNADGVNLSRFAGERQDISALLDHAAFLSSKVNFLLDATLGIISMEQNKTFRVLSMASLVLMPPTLIAGIYGMNFRLFPELEWHWGYPISLGIMLASAVLPLAYFRQKKWL